jgi:ATP adenylyltransferase
MSAMDPSKQIKPALPRGTLWTRVLATTAHALRCGALRPIPTQRIALERDGLRFLVRILINLVRKELARKEQERRSAITGLEVNPFLPYDEDLFVAELSDTHLCILNKFNVVSHHLLIITREFEDQERLLTRADFAALWRCVKDRQGLGFYNAGRIAGASQRHKHLQVVPLPLDPEGAGVPIEPLLDTASFGGGLATVARLPFRHLLARIDPSRVSSLGEAAEVLFGMYRALMDAAGLKAVSAHDGDRQSAPYNLLLTSDWMLLAPRSQEHFESISVNALGFAGCFLVRDEAGLARLRDAGPLRVLREVGIPAD